MILWREWSVCWVVFCYRPYLLRPIGRLGDLCTHRDRHTTTSYLRGQSRAHADRGTEEASE